MSQLPDAPSLETNVGTMLGRSSPSNFGSNPSPAALSYRRSFSLLLDGSFMPLPWQRCTEGVYLLIFTYGSCGSLREQRTRVGNPVGLFQHGIPLEAVPFALFVLFEFTVWVHCPCSASSPPVPVLLGRNVGWGLCWSSMQNTRVGAERTTQSRARGKNREWGPPQCVAQGGEA